MTHTIAVWEWTWAIVLSMAAAIAAGYGIVGLAVRRHLWLAGACAAATKITSPLAYAAVGANFDALRIIHPQLHAGHATAAVVAVSITMSAASFGAIIADPTTRHAGVRAMKWLRLKATEIYRDPFRHTHAHAPIHRL